MVDLIGFFKWLAVAALVVILLTSAVTAVQKLYDSAQLGRTVFSNVTADSGEGYLNWRQMLVTALSLGNPDGVSPGTNGMMVIGLLVGAVPATFLAVLVYKLMRAVLGSS